MELALEMASTNGLGAVTVVNSNHFGYAAYYGEMALARDMIAIVMTNANSLMAPFGGRDAALGTNPICICAPAGEEPPFMFDGATTVVARGKITVAAKKGIKIPSDWGVDAAGHPTDDPNAVVSLSPLGGYKGYDLAVAVDILSGVLGGGPFGPYIGVLGAAQGPQQVGHFLLALNVEAFRDLSGFKRDMDRMLRELRAIPAATGSAGVLIAGDPERAEHAARLGGGVPVPAEIEADLRRLAVEYNLVMPEPLA
jgi:LDH2 family malate/lactate/ureidoglycolate dehydrogenase